MQKDSMHFSTSGHMMHNRTVTQGSPIKSFQCNHCTLIFKSKVYLFEHLNQVHDFDVDTALRDAGLKFHETNKADIDSSSVNHFLCQHCDFNAYSQDVLNAHEKRCDKKSENRNGMANPVSSENQETNILMNQHTEGAGVNNILSVMSTSKTTCSRKDLKTYNRPLQTITKYFAASTGKPSVRLAENPNLLDSTKGTLILQESPSSSNPNSSGVFKVTAKSMIDISKNGSDHCLQNDHHLITDLISPKPKEHFGPTAPNNIGKRTSSESSESCPAKKARSDRRETKLQEKAKASKQQSSSSADFSFEISDDEEEKKVHLFNGDAESPEACFCKHCDYSDVGIRSMSTHYQNDHPYIRYNVAYIQDPSDQSATFRCLECPVEFSSVADLKRHYRENHPESLQVFMMHSRELSLVFKCFLCPFTTDLLKALKEHYKEKHSKYKVDNSLLYCRYSASRCQEGSSRLNTCESTHSPERSGGISPKNANAQQEDVRNAPSPQRPTSKAGDVVLYHCNNCKFSHKSVVVMHVHYQKSHPDDPVTIDKIKQSAHITSHTTSQVTPEKSVTTLESSTPQKNISDSSKKADDKAELSKQKISLANLKHTPEASKTHSEYPKTKKVKPVEDRSKTKRSLTKYDMETSAGTDGLNSGSPAKLFYCRFCSYSSASIRSVVGHHNAKHSAHGPTGTEKIVLYSAKLHKKKLKSEAQASASASSSDSNSHKQVKVCSGKEHQHEEDNAKAASTTSFNPYAHAENLFYCQKCNFGNPTVKGVLNHQAVVHHRIDSSRECIIGYTALVRDEIEKSKAYLKELPFSTHLPLPLMNEGDKNMFFCHFCNYRQMTMNQVLKHYFKRHRGFEISSEQILLHTSLVLKQTQKSDPETMANREGNPASLGKKGDKKKKPETLAKSLSVSESPSVRATQTQRTLQCKRCEYSSQYVYLLRRHMWKIHRVNRTVNEVLRVCFKQGALQSGYHCDMCVFSHDNAAEVFKHYREQHPARKLSLEYISTYLYVGPDASPPKKKKPQRKRTDGISDGGGTDGSLLSQRFGQTETKTYSCRACSFKGSSMSIITRHYHAVHPWSVKEDGSVLNVITSKKPSAGSHVEDRSEMPASSDTHQVPLELGESPGPCHEAAASPAMIKCHYCPAEFHTHRGLQTHCGMKHQEAVAESSDEPQEQQVPIKTRVHIFKCPYCTYVNTNYQGVLTHCQMRHSGFVSRADSLHVDETRLNSLDGCLKGKGPGDSLKFSGYMCKTCSQIYATPEKLNKHCESDHDETVPNTRQPAPKPPLIKIQQPNTHSTLGSVSKASFLRKKIYAVVRCQHCNYSCSTKIALSRHVRVHHRSASVSKVQDCVFKCVLCSSFYFTKKRLGSHYNKKHGRDAFLKYYAPVHKQVPEKSELPFPDCPATQLPENSPEATTDENKLLVYKCPSCPYVNASYHGTLTHCQMKHPAVIARADGLKTEEILTANIVGYTKGKGSNERGYMCKTCPQIHASLMALKIHCQRDHNQAEPAASEHAAETETEEQPDRSPQGSASEAASLKNKTSAASTAEPDLSQQQDSPERGRVSAQNTAALYKCHMCTYTGMHRKYLYCHYKKTHRLDAFSTFKLLEKYNKRKRKFRSLPAAASEERATVKCKKCPDLMFSSSQLLIAHYSTFHSSDCKLDFTVLSQIRERSTGIYKCCHCRKQLNGIRNLCRHLDRHRAWRIQKKTETKASYVVMTTPETTPTEVCRQDEVPMLETVEELNQWSVRPAETFTLPTSPLSVHSKPTDLEQPELEPREEKHTCNQCRRKFMSLKGLRLHERSHAALAAIKKLPTSALKNNINQYVLYKAGTVRPFLCSFCSYRTTVLGLWRSHFMKKHQDVIKDPVETDNQDEENSERANKEPLNLSEERNCLPESDEEPEMTETSLYLEPPDVQRQLNHYSLMAQTGVSSKANLQGTALPDNRLLHCEFCNFNTGHLSSVRRHYLNRHGKKILRCKDCDFFTGLRKTLEMHMENCHTTCQSEATHQKDLRCPFCLYQTKNKNNMIDHIVLHREERVVPIEVRRPKLSRYLQGIVFRCHKCTFTSGSAENLRLHMTRHNDIKPYKCRLCYFDCTLLSDLEAHLSDKHQVVRNHELVGQVSLDQLQARVGRRPEEEEEEGEEERLSDLQHHNNGSEGLERDDFVTDSNEVLHETRSENVALQIEEACQKPEQDSGPRTEDKTQQNAGKGNSADTHSGECSDPERERQTKENQAQPKVRGGESSSTIFTQQKDEAAAGSSTTYGKIAKQTEALKLNIKAIQHRTMNSEARVEDDILRQILVLDKDGRKKADQTRAVKIEQSVETKEVDGTRSELPDDEGRIALARSPKNHMQANNIRIQESLKIEKHLLTLLPNCAKLKFKIRHKDNLRVSFTNCKEEQVRNQKTSQDATDPYGEMPVLENEYLKEETQLLTCCKEEEESDHLEQQEEDKEAEAMTEDNEVRCKDQGNEERDEIKEADSPRVHKSTFTTTSGTAEVPNPSVTEKKLHTCEFCGRNLMNSSELKRHVMRHGI